MRFNNPNFQEQVHNFFLATIHANRFDACAIKCPKIDPRQGDIGSGRDLVDETPQRFLVDDDLFHCCMWLGRRMENEMCVAPRPPLPVSLIKSRMRYIPSMECIKSFGSFMVPRSAVGSTSPPAVPSVSGGVPP